MPSESEAACPFNWKVPSLSRLEFRPESSSLGFTVGDLFGSSVETPPCFSGIRVGRVRGGTSPGGGDGGGGGAHQLGPPLRPVVQSKMAATMKKAVSMAGPGSAAAWARRPGSEEARGGGFEETRGAGGRGSGKMRCPGRRGHGERRAGDPVPSRWPRATALAPRARASPRGRGGPRPRASAAGASAPPARPSPAAVHARRSCTLQAGTSLLTPGVVGPRQRGAGPSGPGRTRVRGSAPLPALDS